MDTGQIFGILEPWAAWLVLGFVLLIGEVLTPGFLLACFAVGCAAAAGVASFDLTWPWQLSAFAATSLAVFFAIRPFVIKHLYKAGEGQRTNVDALVGERGLVVEAFDPVTAEGRVKVRGEDWKGVSASGRPFETGTAVKILRVEGVRVVVEAV